MNQPKAPTVDEIKKRLSAWETYYQRHHQNQKDIDEFYELTFSAQVPKRYPTRKPSTARDWIDAGVRHFTLDNPRMTVYARRPSDAGRKQAASLEAWGNFFLKLSRRQIKDVAKKVLLRGEGFIKINMDDTYFGDYNGKAIDSLDIKELMEYREKRLYHFPIYLTIPDPINVYCSVAHDGLMPLEVIECFEITVSEAIALCKKNGWQFNPERNGTPRRPDEKVTWISYYSCDWRCFILDDVAVLKGGVQRNIFGFVPYVHFSAMAGQTGYDGKPEYEYRPIIHGKQDMFIMESRMLSFIDAINARHAFPRYKFRGNPEVIKQYYPRGVPTDPEKLLLEQEGIMEIDVLSGDKPPEGLFAEFAIMQQLAAAPAIASSGGRPTGVYSGVHQESLIAMARSQYKDAFMSLQEALAIVLGMGLRIIEKVYKHDVMIKNLSADSPKVYQILKVSDIQGYYDCEVALLAEPPEATDTRKALGVTLWQKGAISKRMMKKEYFDMSDDEIDEDDAQRIAEDTMNDPLIRGAMGRDALEQLGMHKALAAIKEIDAQTAALGKEPPLGVKSIPPNQIGEGMQAARDTVDMRGRDIGQGDITSPRSQMEA
jgi:hypothetical protein